MKLHLGCGKEIIDGYVNLDYQEQDGVDVVHDITNIPWPFENNTFEEVVTNHTLEHISDIIPVMNELHRVCKEGALIHISVPYFSCGVTYRDPTHKTFFSYYSFDFFCGNDTYYKHSGHHLFDIQGRKLNFTRFAMPQLNYIFNPLINICPALYERFFCWILPASEVKFTLKVR